LNQITLQPDSTLLVHGMNGLHVVRVVNGTNSLVIVSTGRRTTRNTNNYSLVACRWDVAQWNGQCFIAVQEFNLLRKYRWFI